MKGALPTLVCACALCAGIGAIVAAAQGHGSYAHTIAWAMWLGGSLPRAAAEPAPG